MISLKQIKNILEFPQLLGYRLINSKPISSIVPSSVHCALKCLQNPQCLSYNLEDEARPFHWCELNCLTSDSSRSGLVKSEGYSYYQKIRSHIYGQVDVLPKGKSVVCTIYTLLSKPTLLTGPTQKIVCRNSISFFLSIRNIIKLLKNVQKIHNNLHYYMARVLRLVNFRSVSSRTDLLLLISCQKVKLFRSFSEKINKVI